MIFRILVFSLLVCSVSAQKRPINILPLGDSITQGGKNEREEYTYRYPLFGMLKDAKVNFDFIGSLKTGLHGNAKWPDYKGEKFDLDHEGHYGWKTGKVYEQLPGWMKKYPNPADIALIHLGTNDQGSKDFNKDIIEPLKGMIKLLREKNPQVVVLVGHLNFNGGNALKIRPLVEAMAKETSTEKSPVKTVHFYKGWKENPQAKDADTFDWAHPNPQGQKKMAEKWFEAMQPYLKK
ncbi:MAG: GDSL-type esterase/lipase family protein [Lentisphaeraceae bacterium]|nr:GDSL-type esterase/lipase family protein [Lentisphaeraceae bacterium]